MDKAPGASLSGMYQMLLLSVVRLLNIFGHFTHCLLFSVPFGLR